MTTDEWCVVVVIVDDEYSSENKESTKNTIHTSPLTSAAVNAIFVDIILIYEWQNLDGIFCYLLLLLDMYTHTYQVLTKMWSYLGQWLEYMMSFKGCNQSIFYIVDHKDRFYKP